MISRSLDILKQRAYLKSSGEAIPSLRWQEGIEPKDVRGLFQIYDYVAISVFFLTWAFWIVFSWIMKNLAGLVKSSVAPSLQVAAISHWFRECPTQSDCLILNNRERHGTLQPMGSTEFIYSRLHHFNDEETRAQEDDINGPMSASSW